MKSAIIIRFLTIFGFVTMGLVAAVAIGVLGMYGTGYFNPKFAQFTGLKFTTSSAVIILRFVVIVHINFKTFFTFSRNFLISALQTPDKPVLGGSERKEERSAACRSREWIPETLRSTRRTV